MDVCVCVCVYVCVRNQIKAKHAPVRYHTGYWVASSTPVSWGSVKIIEAFIFSGTNGVQCPLPAISSVF